MDTRKILSELRAERERIERAISALESLNTATHRPGPRAAAARPQAPAAKPARRRRHMSAAARKRMSEMMKKRWAERKKAAKG